MRLIEVGSSADFARAAADWACCQLAANPRAVFALPTGQTPRGLYRELTERARARTLSLADARIFNLDEYCGLAPANPLSYAAFFQRHLIAPLGLRRRQVRLLRGDVADEAAECRAYDAAIARAGGIDSCILGLGSNGHIAFNEPGSSWSLRTHAVRLSAATRRAHAEQGAHPVAMPTRGLTMGIGTILEARHILLLVAGSNKEAARAALHRGVSDPDWPVTSLFKHPETTIIELV